MTKKNKLINKLLSKPKDFTYYELVRLMKSIGYIEIKKGKTSGRVAFFNESNKHIIRLHKPHPKNILKQYQIEIIIEELNQKGVLK